MKNTILFLAFIIYASIIFFVPNLPICIIAFLITNLLLSLVVKPIIIGAFIIIILAGIFPYIITYIKYPLKKRKNII